MCRVIRQRCALGARLAAVALLSSLAGCVLSEHEGIEVELTLRASGGPSGWIHMESIALVPCATTQGEAVLEARNPLPQIPAQLWQLATGLLSPSTAHADHGLAPGLVLEQAQIARFDEGGTSLGMLAPPPASYCAVQLRVTPASADSVGIRQPEETGWSLLLTSPAPQGTPIRSFSSGIWTLPLPEAISLGAERASAFLTITVSPAWPDRTGIDPAARGFEAFDLVRRSAAAEMRSDR